MSKHTPGPWFHHGPSGSQHTAGGFVNSTEERNGSSLVCSIYGTDGQPYKANASLIAAAPDLLEALEKAISRMEEDAVSIDGEWGMGWSLERLEAEYKLPEEIIIARAAIARAKGESQ